MNFQALIHECEENLRAGRVGQAANHLRALPVGDIPRPLALTFANLLRRSQLESMSLRLLTPIVRAEGHAAPATEAEIAEYAAALQKVGAVQEAINLLQPLDPRETPEALLFLSFCHFRRWEYSLAIPLLRRYVEFAQDDYQRDVGRINLAAAYAAESMFFESLGMTKQILERAHGPSRQRLRTNAHELRAQIFIAQDRFVEAREELRQAREPFNGKLTRPVELFLIRKWEAVLEALSQNSSQPLQAFRAEAEERRDWESLREADYFSLKVRFDAEKFQHLLFGTPFAAYRERVLAGLAQEWRQQSYRFGKAGAPAFVLATGEFENFPAEAPSKMVHQLLAALLRDFYKPWSIGALFAELFPGDHFDIFSSPNRVHQLLWRFRKWTESQRIPVEIAEHNGHYSLRAPESFAFEVPRESLRVDENVLHLKRLQSRFKDQPSFTPREAQACLNISASSFKRLAQWGLKEQKLRREGASRATVYKLVG